MAFFSILSFLFIVLPVFTWNQPCPSAPKGTPAINKPIIYSKTPSEEIKLRMEQVEQGLTTQVLTFVGSPFKTATISERLKHHRVNGLSVAIINNNTIEWAKSYGVADASQPDPVTTETLFQAASIGKVITTLAALKLVKEGKISLDEDVNQKLTSWKVPENRFTTKEKVTLRRLLSHSAGFADDYGFGGYAPGEALPTLKQILSIQPPANNKKAMVVSAVPGSVMRYSGGGYVVVQQLIEDVTGQAFPAYVEKEIFQKLGLQHSTYDYYPDKNLKKAIARGHNPDGTIDSSKKYQVFPEAAAAGFWTTPTELAKILIYIQKEQQEESNLILNPDLVKKMLTPQFSSNPRGLGVFLVGAQRPEGFGHSGNNPRYTSLLYATTATGQGAVVMVNSDAGIDLAQEVIRSIANAYNWPFMRTQTVKSLAKEQREKYVGVYQTKEGFSARVGENKNGLYAKFSNPKITINLYAIADHQFILQQEPDNLRLSFVLNNEANVTELVLEKYSGTKIILKKIK